MPSRLWSRLKGILLSPLYLALASFAGAPGIAIHLRCASTGAKLLLTGRMSLKTGWKYLVFPMDSTRYFEFQEVLKSASGFAFTRYLDVSSPRVVPLFLLQASPNATARMINPDDSDLQETKELASALGLGSRCEYVNGVLDNADLIPASFDLITCISVLEHIPQDKIAVETMWSLLRPGGKFILTVPCMARPLDQYISHNPYGVLDPGDDGYTFWQRYYDRERMESVIYSVTGPPARAAVYGEKEPGCFLRNAGMKRLLGASYPFWREPYMMAAEYRSFSSTDELPGEGVVLLEFDKPQETR